MKRTFLIIIVLLFTVQMFGCACYTGIRNPCISPLGICGHSHTGMTTDYIDGGIDRTGLCGESSGAMLCDTVCDPCAVPVYQNHFACGKLNCQNGYPCSNCLVQLADGVRLVGEAALSAAAAPFLIVGNTLCSVGRGGYEPFSGCGCSNEIYLGDNCYQSHDFVDPCSPCSPSNTSCQNCSNVIQNGIQFENSSNSPELKGVITSQKQQRIKQPTYINQRGNIKQAAYIVNQK
ncbi:MAG: hypothetical protein LBE18_03015 [Planctomycetaceae bacterium]|jgi:hypothetical protein|nr:hypothetical protein [Planctomycetaceae bacterium]